MKMCFNILEEDQGNFSVQICAIVIIIFSHPQQHFDTQIMADSAEKFCEEFPSIQCKLTKSSGASTVMRMKVQVVWSSLQTNLDQGYNCVAGVPEWPQKRPPPSTPAKTSHSFVSSLSPPATAGRAVQCSAGLWSVAASLDTIDRSGQINWQT